nr:hypothetical protein [Marinicella sp. W31]MDC2879289.1 hypothetical protein [Marinicella sp. W31]
MADQAIKDIRRATGKSYSAEVKALRREAHDLKEGAAEQTLELRLIKAHDLKTAVDRHFIDIAPDSDVPVLKGDRNGIITGSRCVLETHRDPTLGYVYRSRFPDRCTGLATHQRQDRHPFWVLA